MLTAQTESRTIGGVVYKVQPLPAGMSVQMLARVLKMAAPAFGDVASLREAAGAMGRMLSGIVADLDESTLEFVYTELAKVTTYSPSAGKELPLSGTFDLHFQGRIVDLFEWLRFAAEVTYGPLLARLQEAAAPKAPEAPAAG